MWACSWAASRRGCWARASRTGWPSTTTTRPRSMLTHKIVSPDEAVAVIRDGDTVCTSGFVGIGTPDELILALERRYLAARQPGLSAAKRARARRPVPASVFVPTESARTIEMGILASED